MMAQSSAIKPDLRLMDIFLSFSLHFLLVVFCVIVWPSWYSFTRLPCVTTTFMFLLCQCLYFIQSEKKVHAYVPDVILYLNSDVSYHKLYSFHMLLPYPVLV